MVNKKIVKSVPMIQFDFLIFSLKNLVFFNKNSYLKVFIIVNKKAKNRFKNNIEDEVNIFPKHDIFIHQNNNFASLLENLVLCYHTDFKRCMNKSAL